MLRVLEQLGYDLDALLVSAGLRREDVENPDAYISPGACAAVFARARQQRRVPNLALQLARHTPVGVTPLLDYLIVSSDSVGQGLERLVRYLRLANPGIRLVLNDRRDPVRLVIEQASGPFEVELTVSLSVVRFARETDDRLRAAYVSFTHEPDDAADFAQVLRCPIRVGASWDGWALPAAALRLPLRRRDPTLRRWLERQATEILARLPADGDVRDEVRRVLSTQLTVGDLRVGIVARRLATTARTLQRRLSRAGTSFEAMCDAARKQAAETYLADETLSIAEVTYLLGYSEPTAFHRAFRRWHGTTPRAFRARRSAATESPATR
ncbi:MAG TPA: AraC family transcriptional regulator ligand-binding domain-containing protein [Vicinamibacterales bacterium]|nr:AraC family transcriptional regulator ligand-binding domain-containing protein [Vicinamibacterales bacterium]